MITRPRFSALTYTPPAKVTRLPRRSAVVAFTAQEVYALAELVRRQRGGAAVVLGALSPRTRNAQVALYQAGEVDYLIATDAIGMGLNMDLGHVALASLEQVRRPRAPAAHGARDRPDRRPRRAPHAGRHLRHHPRGRRARPEDHRGGRGPRFPARSGSCAGAAPRSTSGSLDGPARLARRAAAGALPARAPAARSITSASRCWRGATRCGSAPRRPAGVRLLWAVCQIPDFRKTLTEAHLQLLDTVFGHLADDRRLPTDWVADQVARLERTAGDIDTLIARLAHIRTWTYVAHHADWLRDAAHWQERTRAVEDALSDALHDRLTQRFVDRRTQVLLKGLQSGGELAARRGRRLDRGRRPGGRPDRGPALPARARRGGCRAAGARHRRPARAGAGAAAPRQAPDRRRGRRFRAGGWRHRHPGGSARRRRPAAGRRACCRAPTALTPRLELLLADSLSGPARAAVRQRLAHWLDAHLAALARPLRRLQAADLEGPGRGLAFLLVEGLGNVRSRRGARGARCARHGRPRAARPGQGVRFGVRHIYLPAMLKPRAIELRGRLWAVHRRLPRARRARPGRRRLRRPGLPRRARARRSASSGWARPACASTSSSASPRSCARWRAAGRSRCRPELLALTGLAARRARRGGRGAGLRAATASSATCAASRPRRARRARGAPRARAGQRLAVRRAARHPRRRRMSARRQDDDDDDGADGLRLDSWLWQARFFKTRTLAAQLATDASSASTGSWSPSRHYRVRPGDVLTFPTARRCASCACSRSARGAARRARRRRSTRR